MRRRGLVSAAGLASAFALLAGVTFVGSAGAAGCASPAGAAVCAGLPAAPFVTPDQAKQAMTALWNAQERADDNKDAALAGQVFTGTVLLESHYAADSLICGCSKFYWTKGPRTIRNITIYLPSQTHYPLYFMADVLAAPAGTSVPATDGTAVLMVTRSAPSQPWRIEMSLWDADYAKPTAAIPGPFADGNGYDVPQAGVEPSVARAWPTQLAAYYSALKSTGEPPAASPFLPGLLTTGTDLAHHRQGFTSGGVVSHYSFGVSGLGAPWLVNIGGYEASCASILETVTYTLAKPHMVFVQKDGPGQSWGADLDSGYYSKILTTWNRSVCILQYDNGLYVLGSGSNSSYPIHTGGIPAKAPPGTTYVE